MERVTRTRVEFSLDDPRFHDLIKSFAGAPVDIFASVSVFAPEDEPATIVVEWTERQ